MAGIKRRLSVCLSPETLRAIRASAKAESRSISQQVEVALRAWLSGQVTPTAWATPAVAPRGKTGARSRTHAKA